MPFGLTNAPAQFQEYISSALAGLVNITCVVFLDDILIYSKTEQEHIKHVREVLEKLRQYKLYVKLSKCEFHTQETEFLGYIITPKGVKVNQDRVKVIQDWPEPKTVREIRVFIGFMNYYRRFISHFSKKALPLVILTQKGPDSAKGGRAQRKEESQTISIGGEARLAFKRLKEAFLKAPILTHFDPKRETKVETDALGGAISGILSQLCPRVKKAEWRPVGFFSKKLIAEEYNYDVHNKELLTVVKSLLHWKHYLEYLPKSFDLFTDHNNLRYFLTTKSLNSRQTRWSEKLQRFNFYIRYRPGKTNPADGPSRRPDYLRAAKADSLKYNEQNVEALREKLELKDQGQDYSTNAVVLRDLLFPYFACSSFEVLAVHTRTGAGAPETDDEQDIDFEGELTIEIPETTQAADHTSMTSEAPANPDTVVLSPTRDRERTRTPVPTQPVPESSAPTQNEPERATEAQGALQRSRDPTSILQHLTTDDEKRKALVECHDSPQGGHFGVERTLYKVKRKYYWDGIRKDVEDWVHDCLLCTKAKAPKHAPHGLLNPLPIPDGPWKEVTMDFITELPPSTFLATVYDQILVIVDRFSKMAHYIPFKSTWGAKELAETWLREIVRHHPTPVRIISDRGPIMNSKYWDTFLHYLGSKRVLTSAFHPQTDGQTERQNQTLEQYLRIFCSLEQDDWSTWLSIAEFAYNDSRHSITGYTPFEMNTGVGPSAINWPGQPLGSGESPLAWGIAAKVIAMQQECRKKIAASNAYQKSRADKRRKDKVFQVGQRVLVSTRHIRSLRPKKKLDWKFMGPGVILDQIGPDVYRVDLPGLLGAHPVFHASLLEVWTPRGSLQGEEQQREDTLLRFGDEVRDVQVVLDRRQNTVGMWEYLVKWEGLPESENSWEPGPNVPAEVLRKFWIKAKVIPRRQGKRSRGRDVQETGESQPTS
jgi:hypothetical protein